MSLETHDLTPARWPDLERLFGPNGACAGCWCQWWKLEKGETFAQVKGAEARRRLKAQVKAGEQLGVLAYAGGEPVGWLSYGPRRSYPRLDRSPSQRCDDADRVWSLPCFFVKAGHRGQGVAGALLRHALAALRARGAELAEGYPVDPAGRAKSNGEAFTGTRALFEKQGFALATNASGLRQRVRKRLKR